MLCASSVEAVQHVIKTWPTAATCLTNMVIFKKELVQLHDGDVGSKLPKRTYVDYWPVHSPYFLNIIAMTCTTYHQTCIPECEVIVPQ